MTTSNEATHLNQPTDPPDYLTAPALYYRYHALRFEAVGAVGFARVLRGMAWEEEMKDAKKETL